MSLAFDGNRGRAPVRRMITVRQVRSPIGRPAVQRATLKGLGLNKIGRERTLLDTPPTRGMIAKVQHLVTIIERDDRRANSNQKSIKKAPPRSATRPEKIEPRPGTPSPARESRLATPTQVLSLLRSAQLKLRLDGIRQASLLLLAASENERMQGRETLNARDRFELRGFPKRLFKVMLEGTEAEALEAAYALVANSRRFAEGLSPHEHADKLDASHLKLFRSRLGDFLDAVGVRYLCRFLAVQTEQSPAHLHVTVDITQRLPFRIGGEFVELGAKKPDLETLRLGCAAATDQFDVAVRQATKDEVSEGIIASASAEIPVGHDTRLTQAPLTIFFDGTADTHIVKVASQPAG